MNQPTYPIARFGGHSLSASARLGLLALTALNPLNVYKLVSVDILHTSLDVLGPAGIYAVDRFGSTYTYLMLGLLALWIIVPLPIGYVLFKRTDLQ